MLGNSGMQQLLRSPDTADIDRRREIDELVRDPGEAHLKWRELSATERLDVVTGMTKRFGSQFAQRFMAAVTAGKTERRVVYWGPGAGPTAEELVAHGWYFAGWERPLTAEWNVQVWVTPEGKFGRLDLRLQKPSTHAPAEVVPPQEPTSDELPAPLEAWRERLSKDRRFPDQWMLLNRLGIMRRMNQSLARLCKSDPLQEADALAAQTRFRGSYVNVKVALAEVDLGAVSQDLKQAFAKELDETLFVNDDVRLPCCEKHPDSAAFCESILPEN
jgi:hypothetical protein